MRMECVSKAENEGSSARLVLTCSINYLDTIIYTLLYTNESPATPGHIDRHAVTSRGSLLWKTELDEGGPQPHADHNGVRSITSNEVTI